MDREVPDRPKIDYHHPGPKSQTRYHDHWSTVLMKRARSPSPPSIKRPKLDGSVKTSVGIPASNINGLTRHDKHMRMEVSNLTKEHGNSKALNFPPVSDVVKRHPLIFIPSSNVPLAPTTRPHLKNLFSGVSKDCMVVVHMDMAGWYITFVDNDRRKGAALAELCFKELQGRLLFNLISLKLAFFPHGKFQKKTGPEDAKCSTINKAGSSSTNRDTMPISKSTSNASLETSPRLAARFKRITDAPLPELSPNPSLLPETEESTSGTPHQEISDRVIKTSQDSERFSSMYGGLDKQSSLQMINCFNACGRTSEQWICASCRVDDCISPSEVSISKLAGNHANAKAANKPIETHRSDVINTFSVYDPTTQYKRTTRVLSPQGHVDHQKYISTSVQLECLPLNNQRAVSSKTPIDLKTSPVEPFLNHKHHLPFMEKNMRKPPSRVPGESPPKKHDDTPLCSQWLVPTINDAQLQSSCGQASLTSIDDDITLSHILLASSVVEQTTNHAVPRTQTSTATTSDYGTVKKGHPEAYPVSKELFGKVSTSRALTKDHEARNFTRELVDRNIVSCASPNRRHAPCEALASGEDTAKPVQEVHILTSTSVLVTDASLLQSSENMTQHNTALSSGSTSPLSSICEPSELSNSGDEANVRNQKQSRSSPHSLKVGVLGQGPKTGANKRIRSRGEPYSQLELIGKCLLQHPRRGRTVNEILDWIQARWPCYTANHSFSKSIHSVVSNSKNAMYFTRNGIDGQTKLTLYSINPTGAESMEQKIQCSEEVVHSTCLLDNPTDSFKTSDSPGLTKRPGLVPSVMPPSLTILHALQATKGTKSATVKLQARNAAWNTDSIKSRYKHNNEPMELFRYTYAEHDCPMIIPQYPEKRRWQDIMKVDKASLLQHHDIPVHARGMSIASGDYVYVYTPENPLSGRKPFDSRKRTVAEIQEIRCLGAARYVCMIRWCYSRSFLSAFDVSGINRWPERMQYVGSQVLGIICDHLIQGKCEPGELRKISTDMLLVDRQRCFTLVDASSQLFTTPGRWPTPWERFESDDAEKIIDVEDNEHQSRAYGLFESMLRRPSTARSPTVDDRNSNEERDDSDLGKSDSRMTDSQAQFAEKSNAAEAVDSLITPITPKSLIEESVVLDADLSELDPMVIIANSTPSAFRSPTGRSDIMSLTVDETSQFFGRSENGLVSTFESTSAQTSASSQSQPSREMGKSESDSDDTNDLSETESPRYRRIQGTSMKRRVRHTTDLLKRFPEEDPNQACNLDNDVKTADIKARPSRKQRFGQMLSFSRTPCMNLHATTENPTRAPVLGLLPIEPAPDDTTVLGDKTEYFSTLDDLLGIGENMVPVFVNKQLAFRNDVSVHYPKSKHRPSVLC